MERVASVTLIAISLRILSVLKKTRFTVVRDMSVFIAAFLNVVNFADHYLSGDSSEQINCALIIILSSAQSWEISS